MPGVTRFRPMGVPASSLDAVTLTIDEFEALRLADYEGLYQEQAAARMKISRATFGRILESARNKIARVLVEALVLNIEGGEIMTTVQGRGPGGFCICPSCDLRVPHEAGKPCAEQRCTQCGKRMLREDGEHHRKLMEKRGTKS
jgi:uncharacterized protein